MAIRAHGIANEIQQELSARGVHIVYAICPKLAAAGLLNYAAGEVKLFDSQDECEGLELDTSKKYCLAAQTTQDKDIFNTISQSLQHNRELDISILQTICAATKQRQEEAISIAGEVDLL